MDLWCLSELLFKFCFTLCLRAFVVIRIFRARPTMAVRDYASKKDSISRTLGAPAARLKVPSLRSSVAAFKNAPKATRARPLLRWS
jgi:hypothetical protein